MGKDKLKIPLDDQEYVEGFFGLNYRKVYALLGLFLNQTEKELKKTQKKFGVLKSKGSDIYLRMTDLDELVPK